MIRRDWNEFFFSLRPATPLGLFRIAFGLIVFSWCLLIAPDLRTWYSERGVFPLDAMHAWGQTPHSINLLAWFNVTDVRVTATFLAILMAAAICVAIGYKTRVASIVMYVLLVTFHHRDLVILNGGDTLQRNLAFLLMFADSGAACSVDRLIRISRGLERASDVPLIEVWPQRLIQLQISGLYISTVASKVTGPDWRAGVSLYYAFHLMDLQRFPLFGLTNKLWFIMPMTYLTLFTEFSLGALIWVKRLRPYVLMMGLALHLGIEYAMTVPLFSYTVIAAYLNFVSVEWVEALARWLHRQLSRSNLTVPSNLFATGRTAELIGALDVLHLLQPADDSHPTPVYDAALVRRALWRLPVTWAVVFLPLALVFVILPVRWLLIPFGLIWPAAWLFAMYAVSKRVAGSAASSGTLQPIAGASEQPSSPTELSTL